MKLNGIKIETHNKSLEQLLIDHDFNIQYVAVECNGSIIPRAKFKDYIPKPEDEMEVVSFVGGG